MSAPHEHRVRVRYADTDQMGVVHHANYLAYFEEARTELFDSLGASYADLERSGIGLALRRVELAYRAPARFGDVVRVRTRLTELRGASVVFEYEVLREPDTLLTTGLTELACVRLDGLRPERLPRDVRSALEPLLDGAGRP